MKFNELYRLLEKDGWYIERTKKHYIFSIQPKREKYRLENTANKRCQKER